MPLKTCNRCKQDKDANLFYANKRMKDGLNTFCIDCHKADNLERKAKSRQDPLFKDGERAYRKRYRDQNQEFCNELTRQWRAKNAEHLSNYGRAYRQENKALTNHLCQRRKIALLNRTPKWLTDDDLWFIEQAYELAASRSKLTGVKWHVDHILPLRGKTVSGLHTPSNLRVITQKENQRKSNLYGA
jgi:hypothetical protein